VSDIVDDNRESLKAIISAFSFGLRFLENHRQGKNMNTYLSIQQIATIVIDRTEMNEPESWKI
jgi:hypothetical protein